MSRSCGHMLGGGTWAVYDDTPIETQVATSEGMVSILLGEDEQVRLDFLDPDALDRFVRAAKEARRLLRAIEQCPRQS